MKSIMAVGATAGFALCALSAPASAQGFSAVSLIWHSSVVSYCEGRELTQREAQGTAIGFNRSVWQTLKECEANRARRLAAPAGAKKK